MQPNGTADPPIPPDPRLPQRQFEPEIAALFEEYRTLREEVTQRVAARMQLIGFAGAISALLAVSNTLTFSGPSIYIAVLALALAVLWLRGTNLAIQRIGRHLRDIETRINTLAAQAWGSPCAILTWETRVHDGRRQVRGIPRRVGRLGGWYTP